MNTPPTHPILFLQKLDTLILFLSLLLHKPLQYLSDAVGHLGLFLGVLATVFELPLPYHFQFRGTRSLVWPPSSFWSLDDPQRHAHSLHLYAASTAQEGGRMKAACEAALLATERGAAVAFAERWRSVGVSRAALLSPMEWLTEVCSALLEESGTPGVVARRDARCRLQMGARDFTLSSAPQGPQTDASIYPHAEEDKSEDGWELMVVGGWDEDDGLASSGGASSSANSALGLVFDRLRWLTSAYKTG